ncbi:hypothetical protein AB3N61_18175 [Leptospira sp. WS58.C1]|uniref:hypothetical protein n=1 Tax=Leptospira cinconiae TaxID=3235173 RepID=UPI00349F03C1
MRKTIYILLFALISCKENVSGNHIIKSYESITGNELSELLGIKIKAENSEKYSGYLSFKFTNGVFIKDGQFSFISKIHKKYSEDLFENEIKYEGKYLNDSLDGVIREEFYLNDNVDIYAKYLVLLSFNNGVCKSGQFNGQIGYRMPKAYIKTFPVCNFLKVREMAWEQWGRESNFSAD